MIIVHVYSYNSYAIHKMPMDTLVIVFVNSSIFTKIDRFYFQKFSKKMDFHFSVCSDCFSNIKKLETIDSNDFIIHINDKVIKLPLLTAVSLSTKITENLLHDSTLREKTFNVEFKEETSVDKIIGIHIFIII